jgi:predicted dehydrogenase
MSPTAIGIIGCGDILDAYMIGLRRFGADVRRVADVDLDRASAGAERHSIPAWGSVDELWQDQDIGLVVSLTPPKVHHEIIEAAATAGKDLYTEKPLSATTELARGALEVAEQRGITVGSAPDTFLGSAAQTARAALDGGEIGEVIAVTAFAPYNRAELRHPNPGFLFQAGAGPLLDIPPYHLSWLIHLLGPVAKVAGLSRMSADVRRVPAANGSVVEIPVEVDTHVTSVLEFSSGVLGTFIGSFDVWSHRLPSIEIYGSLGTMSLPHPNWYDGPVEIRLHDDEEWHLVESVFAPIQTHPTEKVRGLGVVDLLNSTSENRSPRTSNNLALHVLEVLEAMQVSSQERVYVSIETRPDRPAPLRRSDLEGWRS